MMTGRQSAQLPHGFHSDNAELEKETSTHAIVEYFSSTLPFVASVFIYNHATTSSFFIYN